jgi:hypothetical protein
LDLPRFFKLRGIALKNFKWCVKKVSPCFRWDQFEEKYTNIVKLADEYVEITNLLNASGLQEVVNQIDQFQSAYEENKREEKSAAVF